MSTPVAALIAHLALLSLISFGGVPGVLPDLRAFVVTENGWITARDFANCFAIVQAIPGPNMILLTSLLAWKVGGFPAAIAGAFATFAPSCTLALIAFRLWERFRNTAWQKRTRRGLAPVTIGLVIAGGFVMAQTGDFRWSNAALTTAAAGLVLSTRLNPVWLIAAGGALGACGLV
jgi:chromate transporter